MATVGKWSGYETRALREALRMSVRSFAAHLGVNERTVTKWECGGTAVCPRPEMQAALDTTLERANDEVVTRFEAALQSAPSHIAFRASPAHNRDAAQLSLREVISVAAAESTRFLVWAEMENVGDLTLEQLQSEVRRIARAYSKEPAGQLFMRSRELRDRAFTLLEGKHRPSYQGHAKFT